MQGLASHRHELLRPLPRHAVLALPRGARAFAAAGSSGSSATTTSSRASATSSSASSSTQHRRQQPQQPADNGGAVLLGRAAAVVAAGVLALSPLALGPPHALAADTVKVGTCLLRKCQLQLAQCLGDPQCLQNIVCLNLCNSADDEAGCQIRCGDLYGDKAVDTFNACAVSEQKCVPQRQDEGLFPVPADCALESSFDLASFTGRWYITAGLNPLFDTFDCQEHFFAVPEPGRMAARINWRINKPNGDFIERSVVQTFKQDESQPALLLNHGNEYLHYQDDWYIVGFKPDTYVVVYYKGSNDAWDGYGGAVVYTKARQLPPELVPELSAAVEKVGLKWDDFIVTDNSCKPHPPPKSLVQEIEDEAAVLERGLQREATELEGDFEGGLRSFARGFTVLERKLQRELTAEERTLQAELRRELQQAEKVLEKVEAQVAAEERVLENKLESEVQGVGAAFSKLLGTLRGK